MPWKHPFRHGRNNPARVSTVLPDARQCLVAQAIGLGVYEYDFVTGEVKWSREFRAMLGLDAEAIAEIDGKRVVYGFVSEYVGHKSVILKTDGATMMWGPAGNATWNEDDGSFRFDNRDGTCNY